MATGGEKNIPHESGFSWGRGGGSSVALDRSGPQHLVWVYSHDLALADDVEQLPELDGFLGGGNLRTTHGGANLTRPFTTGLLDRNFFHNFQPRKMRPFPFESSISRVLASKTHQSSASFL